MQHRPSSVAARLASTDSAIAATANAVVVAKGSDPLQLELLQRYARDQKVRERLNHPAPANFPPAAAALWSAIFGLRETAIDCDNTRWLKSQVVQGRWFDIPTYGAAADEAAWHLVQHADRELRA